VRTQALRRTVFVKLWALFGAGRTRTRSTSDEHGLFSRRDAGHRTHPSRRPRRRLALVTVLLAVGSLVVSSCDWAQLRYGSDGTGFNPFEKTIGASNVAGVQRRWSEASRVRAIESSPVVANGVVYASSFAGGYDGRLDAFDAATGTVKWSYSKSSPNVVPGGWVPSPAVANGVVYDMAGDGTLYAIDANSGTKRWSTTTSFPYPSSLVVANGFVYVAADAGLFVFNATTGASLWSDDLGVGGYTSMVPAVANGVVYATPTGGAYRLYAHDATTGKVLWSADRSDVGGGSSPAVANGVVYVSDHGAWIGDPGLLSAFNATTGAKLWSAVGGHASPAVANGVVYDSADDGTLSAFNAGTGARLWSTSTGATAASSPVVANGVVYVGDANGNLDGFSVTNGAKLWSASTPASDPGASALPVVDNGVVYAAANDEYRQVGQLVAYGLPVPTAELTMSPTFAPDYGTVVDGTSTRPTTFTVTNFGSATSSTVTGALSGADSSQYHVTSDRCSGRALAGNASCTIEVAFRPTIPGVRTATLAVHAATGGSAAASLTGVGNALTITPAAKDYGTVLEGTRSPTTTFTVTNVSAMTVSPSVASLAGTQFTATSDSCIGGGLVAAATCTVGVAFTPRSLGSTGAILSVSSTPGATTTAFLYGTAPLVAIVPGSKDYGTVLVGSSSPATFTITNVTAATSLTLFASAVSGTGFDIPSDGCNGTTLAVGASCTDVVTFTPTGSGATYAGELAVNLDGIGPINQATLVGKGG
jgi:outer membrane protein assembly factor BamB